MNWMLAAILQRKDVYDTSDAYYITDYTYDDQGRLASYVRVGYNTQYSDIKNHYIHLHV